VDGRNGLVRHVLNTVSGFRSREQRGQKMFYPNFSVVILIIQSGEDVVRSRRSSFLVHVEDPALNK